MFRDASEIPSAAEWGLYRAKMARRGVTQAWIDKYCQLSPNGRTRKETEEDLSLGYLVGQLPTGGANQVSISLTAHLQNQGWDASFDGMILTVIRHTTTGDETYLISYGEVTACDYSGYDWPAPLKVDIHNWMAAEGNCP